MHALNRSTVSVPSCLAAPPAGQSYDDLHGAEKAEIRATLLDLQKHRCAYCERRTADERDDGHIEHFRNQDGHPQILVACLTLFVFARRYRIQHPHRGMLDALKPEIDSRPRTAAFLPRPPCSSPPWTSGKRSAGVELGVVDRATRLFSRPKAT